MEYDRLAVSVVVKTAEGGIQTCDIPVTDDFQQFRRDYETLTGRVRETAREKNIPVVGLSALMTTTAPAKAETNRRVKEAALDCQVVVGGAVITQDYADSIGAHHYAPDAMDTVHYAQTIFGA